MGLGGREGALKETLALSLTSTPHFVVRASTKQPKEEDKGHEKGGKAANFLTGPCSCGFNGRREADDHTPL